MITIKIGDAFSKVVEECHEFSQQSEAQRFLSAQVPELTTDQMVEIFRRPGTQFQRGQLRDYPEKNAALIMMVRYEIEVAD